ncbi:hypothetical protein CYY_002209 [Polysphondylium violaceum]|uniref:KANL3/Tex30 alpha/beta hydrolase-like domain-containing protein n=1 Tax=Polysphondylium violaceum TaxID=133409 RepID=A0A8J4V9U0_9MYCE|nr:hypothetical protein CYY_002209 [Polysphondylium violaceum]
MNTTDTTETPTSTTVLKLNKYKKVERRSIFLPVLNESSNIKLEGLLSWVDKNHVDEQQQNGDAVGGYSDTQLYDNVAVVITHPHPMLGGNYRNNVVLGVADYLTSYMRIPTLCFNFRGVGRSDGTGSWRGSTERTDTLSAVQYLLNSNPLLTQSGNNITKVIIVGYSYGSVIGSSVADEHDSIIGFTAISYPFGPLTLMLLGHLLEPALNSPKPKLFVTGDKDNFTGVPKFKTRMSEMKGTRVESKIFEGVDHFYQNSEKMLSKEIAAWIHTLCK